MDYNPKSAEDLQFDKAQYIDTTVNYSTCEICRTNLTDAYFKINQSIVCPSCKAHVARKFSLKDRGAGILKALLFGLPAAIFGGVIYYAIVALSGYEIGLVALVIGWMVGTAVRKGSNDRGGLPYQMLAVLLTYMAIASFYFPYILKSVSEDSTPSSFSMMQLLVVFGISLGTPFILGFKNILGLLIIGFALFEAWRLNQKAILDIQGPFSLRPNQN